MSARLARAEVLAALREGPASGATVGDLSGVTGLSAATITKAVARLIAEGDLEIAGAGVRLKPPPVAAPSAEAQREQARAAAVAIEELRERLLSVRAGREDRATIARLLDRLRDPAAQAEALVLLARLEAR